MCSVLCFVLSLFWGEGRYVLSIVVCLLLFALCIVIMLFCLFSYIASVSFVSTNVIGHSWLMANNVNVVCCIVLLLMSFVYIRLCVFVFLRTKPETKNRQTRT